MIRHLPNLFFNLTWFHGKIFSMKKEKKKLYIDIAIVVVCLFLSSRFIIDVVSPFMEAKEENASLTTDIETASEKQADLEASLNENESSDDMEKGYMRERFHMSDDDELIFVFPE